MTEGLTSSGQREVTLTVLRRGGAESGFPEGVLAYIPALERLGVQGKVVKVHDVSGYRAPGPFGLGPFVGVAFVEAAPIPEVHAPPGALAGVFLTEGELAMATRCSVLRVLHRLGKVARYFPTPYWSDPSRQTVYDDADVERSVLSQLERAVVPEAAATLEGDVMRLLCLVHSLEVSPSESNLALPPPCCRSARAKRGELSSGRLVSTSRRRSSPKERTTPHVCRAGSSRSGRG